MISGENNLPGQCGDVLSKPEGVSAAMKTYMDEIGATINRSVYGSAQDAGLVTLQLLKRT